MLTFSWPGQGAPPILKKTTSSRQKWSCIHKKLAELEPCQENIHHDLITDVYLTVSLLVSVTYSLYFFIVAGRKSFHVK